MHPRSSSSMSRLAGWQLGPRAIGRVWQRLATLWQRARVAAGSSRRRVLHLLGTMTRLPAYPLPCPPSPAQGEEIGSGKGNSHSLWVLSRRLVRMLLKQSGPIALTAAAAVLVGPGGVSDPSKHRSQTQVGSWDSWPLLWGLPCAGACLCWCLLVLVQSGRFAVSPSPHGPPLIPGSHTWHRCPLAPASLCGAAAVRHSLPFLLLRTPINRLHALPHSCPADHRGAAAVRHWLDPLLRRPAGAHLHEEAVG